MIPSGWGGYGTYIYCGIGGAYPQVYRSRSNEADFAVSVGFCIGDPYKAVNVAASMNI